MKSQYLYSWAMAALGAVLISGTAWAQNSDTGNPGSATSSGPVNASPANAGTVNDAFQTARQAVKPELQTKVVSLYGIGTPNAIGKWYVIFYDPTVDTHGRVVLVENNQVTKTYPANGGTTYSAALTFDPSRITSEQPALSAAEGYAAKHDIAYNSVRLLLKQASADKPFRWRVELLSGDKSKGFVFVNAMDDTVAYYTGPSSGKKSASGSSDDSAAGFANDVKHTFLGIGGDLEEFFTGERTVDK